MMNYFAMLLSSLREHVNHGFCYRCERYTIWYDRGPRYHCSHCGHDPVHNRPE